MASNTIAIITLLLALNLLFFTLVSSSPCAPPAHKVPKVRKGHKVHHAPKHCPKDTLKLGICANVLNSLLNIIVGTPPNDPKCCSVIEGLLDAEAAACLCTVIKADVIGIKLRVPVALNLLLNSCGKKLPKDFQCAQDSN